MFDKYFEGWSQKDKWKGVFEIEWIYLKDIPNKEFKEIRNPYIFIFPSLFLPFYKISLNSNKPVHNSRDCQEVPTEEGIKVVKIFQKSPNISSIIAKIKG